MQLPKDNSLRFTDVPQIYLTPTAVIHDREPHIRIDRAIRGKRWDADHGLHVFGMDQAAEVFFPNLRLTQRGKITAPMAR